MNWRMTTDSYDICCLAGDRARGLGRRTLKTITHHSQQHTEADNETYMQTYPQKSFPRFVQRSHGVATI